MKKIKWCFSLFWPILVISLTFLIPAVLIIFFGPVNYRIDGYRVFGAGLFIFMIWFICFILALFKEDK